MKLKHGTNPDDFAKKHGWKNFGQVGELEDIYLFELAKRARSDDDANREEEKISKDADLEWIEFQEPRIREKKEDQI